MPFAGYKNFADCTAKNASKKDPQAYCSVIMRAAEGIQVWEREFSTTRRKNLSDKGYALPDGSFPIVTAGDLDNAIKAIGRAKNPAAAKAHIIKRAKALGKTNLLPADWSSSTKAKEGILPMKPQLTDRVLIDVQEAEFNKDEETGKMTAHLQIIKAGRPIGKKRDYTAPALQKAAQEGIYNGIRMFVDHSDKPPTSRKMQEMVSAVEGTTWDSQRQAIMGDVEFFDQKFFDYAQRAKKHMGVSADHVIAVNYVQEGRDRIERVTSIPMARSVDWVVYPAAGGEILSFAKEAEGEDQVEWSEVTLDQIKEHAPALLEAYKAEVAQESTSDEHDDDPPPVVSREDIALMVQEGVAQALEKADSRATNIRAATAKVRDFVSKSGLPGRTQARIVNTFSDSENYNEVAVKEAIDEAKEELKEAGARGPRITGMGPSGDPGNESSSPVNRDVQESVEAVFGIKKAEKKD